MRDPNHESNKYCGLMKTDDKLGPVTAFEEWNLPNNQEDVMAYGYMPIHSYTRRL